MKVMLDTNVILDLWLAREPFWNDAARLMAKVESKEIEGYLCPTTVATLHYLGRKVVGERRVRDLLGRLLEICRIGTIDAEVFQSALASRVRDFEDAVIEAVSIHGKIDAIATRNLKDFKHSRIPAREPSRAAT